MVVTNQNITPLQKYQADLASGGFTPDAAQRRAVEALQRLYDDLLRFRQQQQGGLLNRIKAWFGSTPKAPQGIYFWGGVGRGKTYLVDTFYETLPFEQKLRVHFHRFMHRVHKELKELKGKSDPLPIIADKLASELLWLARQTQKCPQIRLFLWMDLRISFVRFTRLRTLPIRPVSRLALSTASSTCCVA